MTRRIFHAALGLWASVAGANVLYGQDVQKEPNRFSAKTAPAELVQTNQITADAIAASLRQSGVLRNFRVDISFAGGVADLSGLVQDSLQRDEVVRVVQAVPGVRQVRERLTMAQSLGLRPVQAKAPEFEPFPPVSQPPPFQPPPGGIQEPQSIIPPIMGPGPNPQMQPPPMPPYAWPTYAPYNNFSRVASPNLYPYEAFPFIGPMYPYPKVPPGWRAVTLRWQDGYWWYGKEASGHDWWRVRYW